MGVLDELEAGGSMPEIMKNKHVLNTEKENLVIIVNRPSAVELPPVMVAGEHVPGQVLIPGENAVDSAVWAAMQKNPAIKLWVKCEVLRNNGLGKAKPLSDGLDVLKSSEAEKRVLQCQSIPIIQDWKGKTDSPALQRLCAERIQVLLATDEEAE